MESIFCLNFTILIQSITVESIDPKNNIFEQLSLDIRSTLLNSKYKNFPVVKTAEEFRNNFSLNEIFDVPVGLIFDEFDVLMDHQELISTLLSMKQNPELYCVNVFQHFY
jgi:hypothetical protein